MRVAEIVVRESEKAKPDKWGCVQVHELWSPQEESRVRPGHFWLLKFGKVPGINRCVEKKFKLGTRKYEKYNFEEWDPSTDTDSSEAPVSMIVNSSELCSVGFDLREVIPLQLETVVSGSRRTRGAAIKQIHGMGTRRYVLSVDNENECRSRCE